VNARIINFEVDDGNGVPVDVSSDAGGTFKWIDMSNWDSEPIPQRQWAIFNRVPLNQAGLFSGEGGTGKSIIELTKNVAHVIGKEWFGSLQKSAQHFILAPKMTRMSYIFDWRL
jgi:RecA-family ATPase